MYCCRRMYVQNFSVPVHLCCGHRAQVAGHCVRSLLCSSDSLLLHPSRGHARAHTHTCVCACVHESRTSPVLLCVQAFNSIPASDQSVFLPSWWQVLWPLCHRGGMLLYYLSGLWVPVPPMSCPSTGNAVRIVPCLTEMSKVFSPAYAWTKCKDVSWENH